MWQNVKLILKENWALLSAVFIAALLPILYLINQVQTSNQPSSNDKSHLTIASPSANNPCIGALAPVKWKHVVVLMFENKNWNQVIGSSKAPFISHLASDCGTAYSGTFGSGPLSNWHDANYKVNGIRDGVYASQASYATLTTGLSPSEHGLTTDILGTTSNVDNIYKRLKDAGFDASDYYESGASPSPCTDAKFNGDYHDAIRYYIPSIGLDYCNSHDKPISTFMGDVNSSNLPAFSMIIPSNCNNMHKCLTVRNLISHGDSWAKGFLTPLLNSDQYKSGDTAIFFLWDEDTPIPNVLIAPSIISGSRVPVTTGNPISHFSATRTWSEMLGILPLGDSGQAPSLLYFFNGAVNTR